MSTKRKQYTASIALLFMLLICSYAFAKTRTLSWAVPATYTDGTTIGADDNITCSFYIKDVVTGNISALTENSTDNSFVFNDNTLVKGRTYKVWGQAYSPLYSTYSDNSPEYTWMVPYYTTLLTPGDNTTGLTSPVTFTWESVPGAMSYNLQVDTDNTFASPDVNIVTGNTSYSTSALIGGTAYYWRVRAIR